ncbi:MAG: DNA polymerase III subunit beta [Clostridia bacterium]|nr:DNA polymerase III subunit beta [Lachnospiraceae bacterium]MBQ6174024.1 DNA polymerase III subunit beta [Clostridia bacterium]MBR4458767.1 DNA polymerase III subunit beta [Clostridia bacterium]
MNIKTNVQELMEGLGIATRALASRPARPILDGVLIDASEDSMVLTCSDGSMTIESTVPAEVKEPGRVVLPGRIFAELTRKLPGGEMSIRVSDTGRAQIQCLSSKSSLSGLTAEDYPETPETVAKMTLRIDQAKLRGMISRVVFSISSDESRQLLTGCLLEVMPDEMRIVALDGFRLAMQVDRQAFALPAAGGTFRAVIPGRVMNELSRILPDEEGECVLTFDQNHMTAAFGSTKISTVLLAGEYIDYRRILPQSFETRALVNRTEMQNAIDRASLMAREGKNNLIRMTFDQDTLTINSNAELGDVHEEMSALIQGSRIEIAFNAKYISDVMRSVQDDELCMCFNSSVSPCVVVPREGDAYLYLILPVRIFQ